MQQISKTTSVATLRSICFYIVCFCVCYARGLHQNTSTHKTLATPKGKDIQNDPKVTPMCSQSDPQMTPQTYFPGVLSNSNTPREWGIELGPSALPATSRAPNHYANPALESCLPKDFLCTKNAGPGLALRVKSSSAHKNTTLGNSGSLISVFLMYLLEHLMVFEGF